jgi:hypothetical protein
LEQALRMEESRWPELYPVVSEKQLAGSLVTPASEAMKKASVLEGVGV